MARSATSWAYGACGSDVLKLGLSASELALLRAICWKYNERKQRTDPVTNDYLAVLTGIKSPQTLNALRTKLKNRGLITYAHANEVTKYCGKDKETSLAYVYHVRYKRLTA